MDMNNDETLELFPDEDFEFVTISPFLISNEGFGYSLKCMVSFQKSIGLKVFDELKFENETSKALSINYRNIKLFKIVVEPDELENDIISSLKLLERIINHVCSMENKLIEKTILIDTNTLDDQLDLIIRKRELEKRGEIPKSFGIIHAKGRKDAVERVGSDLVPIYLETDKAYLYEDKKVYLILPRDFVMKLLKMDSSTLIPSEQFTDKEKEVLRQLCMRNYIKKIKVANKTFYHDLNEKTRKLLLKGLKKF
ncbi:MAG: hypothetical protein P8X91_04330 [Candidatus Bathyarchaeota archaeon]